MGVINPDSPTSKQKDPKFGGFAIKESFLVPGLYRDLESELHQFVDDYPDQCIDEQETRKRIVIGTPDWSMFLKQNPRWRWFTEFLQSQEFVDWWSQEMAGLFESQYPGLAGARIVSGLKGGSIFQKIKRSMQFNRARPQVTIEGDISFARTGYQVGPHHDNERKRLVGLLYFGSYPEDDREIDEGGHLMLLKYRSDEGEYRKLQRRQEKIDERFEKVSRVRAEKNKACLFVNSKSAIHAVTPYSATPPRMRVFFYFSICAQDKNLFGPSSN